MELTIPDDELRRLVDERAKELVGELVGEAVAGLHVQRANGLNSPIRVAIAEVVRPLAVEAVRKLLALPETQAEVTKMAQEAVAHFLGEERQQVVDRLAKALGDALHWRD